MRRLLRHAPITAAVAITLGLVAGVTTSGAAFDTYRNEVMADGPAAYWRMGDSTSTLVDETGANPGGYSGGFALGTQGAIWNDANTAATFDGIRSSAAVADSPSLRMSTGVSVELWVRRKTSGSFQPLVGKPLNGQSKFENYSIWLNSSNRPVAYFGNGTTYVSVQGAVLDTSWHHVVATYDNATARIYVDGVLSASQSSTVHLTPTADPVNIGRSASGSFNANVDLDEVAIYGTVLSAARVSAHYGAARSDSQAPVVTLTSPADGSASTNRTPAFAGSAGVLGGDNGTVTVKVYAGSQASGTPVQTLSATRSAGGGWSVQPAALSDGTYTARAEQRDDAGNTGLSGTRTFTVDTVAPTASITQSPPDPANSASASIAFTADEQSATFACSLDGSAFASCTSPRSLSNLADGSHTFRVRATDAAGNTGATASATWRVDTAAPTVTITDGPPSLTGDTSASVSFTASETATFACSLDGAGFSACTSPDAVSGLADGSHTLLVRATDAAGNTGAAASRSWTVDTTAPAPTLTVPPDGSTTNDDTPTLSGTAGRDANDQPSVTVQLYAGTSVGDTPLQTLTANRRSDGTYSVDAAQVPDGSYTAQTSQQDTLGHVGTSAPSTFTIDASTTDTTPPTVRLIVPGMNSSTQDTTPTFSGMAGSDPGDLDAITVSVYSGGSPTGTPLLTLTATRQADGSFSTEATELPEGTYTAQASQSDAAGNVGISNSKTFSIDTTAPFASITSAPPAFSGTANPSVAFTADESNVSYACSLDGAAFSVCTSPATYSGVADGDHTFAVHATDAAGNVGPDVSAAWTTDTVAPTTSITASPADPTSATSASFSFSADEPSVTYWCRLDAAAWAPCDSPAAYSGLADGVHTFRVRAIDRAGNAGAIATTTWTVDTTAPAVRLTAPANGSSSAWPQPAFSGVAGTAPGDAPTVTVRLWTGTSTSGDPVDTLTATPAADGTYSVAVPSFHKPGTYTARADQLDGALNTGRSAANTFSITDPVMLAAGDDTSCETSDGDTATSQILLDHPDAIVAPLGDTAYSNGTPAEFSNCYTPTWGRVLDRTFPAVGNHEYDTANAQGYFDYFNGRLSPFGAAATDPTRGWYSYDLGAWHVVVLNSNCTLIPGGCDVGGAEEQWLRADLAAHPGECTLAMFHHPLFASDAVHGPNTEMRTFFRDLYNGGADVVLNGHAHVYERFLPQTADGVADPNFGVQEFVVGTGGYFEYQFGTIQPNSAARTTNVYGVLKLSLHSTGWDWQFLPEAGRTFDDSGSGTCHGTPPPPPPGVPTVRSASANTANAATSMTIPAPAGSLPGDLLLAVVSHQVAQFRNMTPPAGWTAVPNTDVSEGNNVRLHAWYKVATAAEPSSYTFTLTGGSGQDISGGILAVSGADTTAPINASASQSNGSTSSTAIKAPSITTTVNNALDVFGGSCSAAVSYTAPLGMVEQWDRSSSGTYKASTEVATAGQPTAGATGVRTGTASSSCRSVGVQIAIAPPSG